MPLDRPSKPFAATKRRVIYFSTGSFRQLAQDLKGFGDHVARHLLRTVAHESVSVEAQAVPRDNKGLDALPQRIVRNTDHGRAAHLATLEENLFHFRRTDPETARLDHRVAPTYKVQEPVLVHLDEISGVTDFFAVSELGRQKWIRAQRACSIFRAVPVSH